MTDQSSEYKRSTNAASTAVFLSFLIYAIPTNVADGHFIIPWGKSLVVSLRRSPDVVCSASIVVCIAVVQLLAGAMVFSIVRPRKRAGCALTLLAQFLLLLLICMLNLPLELLGPYSGICKW